MVSFHPVAPAALQLSQTRHPELAKPEGVRAHAPSGIWAANASDEIAMCMYWITDHWKKNLNAPALTDIHLRTEMPTL